MEIRQIKSKDQAEWLRMRLALWPDTTPEDHLKEMKGILADTENFNTFVAVRENGSLGGFLEASLRPYSDGCITSPVGYIEGWYVDPDLRQKGLGKLLVKAAEDWARSIGLKEMASDCVLENELSLKAHLAIGYEEVERQIKFRKSLIEDLLNFEK